MASLLNPGQQVLVEFEIFASLNFDEDHFNSAIAQLEALGFRVGVTRTRSFCDGILGIAISAQQTPHTAINPRDLRPRIAKMFSPLRLQAFFASITTPPLCCDSDWVLPSRCRYDTGFLVDTKTRIHQWCEEHGYTDPFFQEGRWWGFPPSGVMPIRLDSVID